MSLEPAAEVLRVAQVIGSFEGGGAQRQAWNLVAGLRAQGIDACGVAVRRAGSYVDPSRSDLPCHALGAVRGRRWTIARAALRLRRLVTHWRPHVIHVQGADCLLFCWYALWGLGHKPLMVFTWHDSGRVLHHQGKARNRMCTAMAACGAVLGSSADVAARLGAAASLSNVGVFHGGVPECPAARPSLPPLVVWVGRFEPAKDPARLIRACALIRQQGEAMRVVMAGGPHQGSGFLEEMRALVCKSGLSDMIALPGHLGSAQLEALYSQASIGVQTSLTEGLSMALLEQMMRGHAIVATSVGDTAVALDGGRCGHLMERDADPSELARILLQLVRDPERAHELGLRARRKAQEEYSLEAMARRAATLYRLVLYPPAP